MCDLQPRDEESSDERIGVADFVDELVVAVTNSRIYWHEHPRVKTSIKALRKALEHHLGGQQPDHLVIGTSDGCLFYHQRPLLGASLSAPRIIAALEELNSGGLVFCNWATEEDFVALIELLGKSVSKIKDYGEANRHLESKGCTAIQLLPSYDEVRFQVGDARTPAALLEAIDKSREEVEAETIGVPVKLYQSIVDHLQDTMINACHGRDLTIEETKSLVETVLGKLDEDAETMMRISRYERYDAYTFGHSIRVCFLALYFASALNDDHELLQRIGLSALVHDIGKAWVPFEVLHATGRLTADERRQMNRHAEFGGQILLNLGGNDPMPVVTAFGHHRTMDDQGYPETLHAYRQSLGTRIIKICDVYEALTAVRPYKPPMSPVRAYRIMMSMDGHFDRRLLRRFIQVNGMYPLGSRVRLTTGEIARVKRQSRLLKYPIVEIVVDKKEGKESAKKKRYRDLSRSAAKDRIAIAEFLLEEAA